MELTRGLAGPEASEGMDDSNLQDIEDVFLENSERQVCLFRCKYKFLENFMTVRLACCSIQEMRNNHAALIINVELEKRQLF